MRMIMATVRMIIRTMTIRIENSISQGVKKCQLAKVS